MEAELNEKLRHITDMIDDMRRDLKHILTAFPGGVEAHAEEHRISIENTANFKKLKMSLTERVMGWSVIGLIGAALIGLWKSWKGI